MADFFAMIDESRQGYITKEELRKFFRIKVHHSLPTAHTARHSHLGGRV